MASTEPRRCVSSSFFVGRSAYEQGTKICRRADAASHKPLYPFQKIVAEVLELKPTAALSVTHEREAPPWGRFSMGTPGSRRGEAQVRDRTEITIAIVGGNTVAGLALSFLLRGAGYDTIFLKAPPPRDLFGDVDLLLVSPDLDHERRKGSLAILRDNKAGKRVPVLTFSATVEENVFAGEAAGSSWPVEIGGLARAIETTLRGGAESESAIVANSVGEAVLLQPSATSQEEADR